MNSNILNKLSIITIIFFLTLGVLIIAENNHHDQLLARIGKNSEELWIRPIPSANRTVISFQFLTIVESSDSIADYMHYKLFPKVLGQLLSKYSSNHIKITFTAGRWNHKLWGRPFTIGPFGVELQASIRGSSTSDRYRKWEGIKAELSGIFSVSMKNMDSTRTFQPPNWFINKIDSDTENFPDDSASFYGSLPREEFCTENLSPWIKLLPCRSHAGFGHFTNPISIMSSDFNSMSLSITNKQCAKDGNCQGTNELKLKQTFTTVQRTNGVFWSIESLLGRSLAPNHVINRKCPLASSSRVYVEVPHVDWLVNPPSIINDLNVDWYMQDDKKEGINPRKVAVYDMSLSGEEFFDFAKPILQNHSDYSLTSSGVFGHRFIGGYGQVHGALTIQISNNLPFPIIAQYMDHIPWFVRIYFHTIDIKLNGKKIQIDDPIFNTFDLQPGDDHGRPNTLWFIISLKEKTTLTISVKFEKVFLALEEHPPDSNRGLDISSSVIIFKKLNTPDLSSQYEFESMDTTMKAGNSLFYVLEPLLVPLPTPDFSMPYNVITLTSTVIAFFVGTMINTLLRRRRKSTLEKAIAQKDNRDKPTFFQKLKKRFIR